MTQDGGVNGNLHILDNCFLQTILSWTQYGSAIGSKYITNCEFKNNGKNTVDYPRQIKNCLFINNGSRTISGIVPPQIQLL